VQRVALITGTGKGIGKAIANLLLSKDFIVFGYSRTNTINHLNFTFKRIDLSNLEKVQRISFPKFDNAEILLINNAATIGEITTLNLKNDSDIINEYNLNIITPTILCAKFINIFFGQ
jgi:short-subunit dehydrogenase